MDRQLKMILETDYKEQYITWYDGRYEFFRAKYHRLKCQKTQFYQHFKRAKHRFCVVASTFYDYFNIYTLIK